MIYVFDLDGTLCTQTLTGDYRKAQPIWERIDAVNRLYDDGHTIIIDTARGSVTGVDWHSRTIRQLGSWNLQYHRLITGAKPFGNVYVDDKGTNSEDFFKGGE